MADPNNHQVDNIPMDEMFMVDDPEIAESIRRVSQQWREALDRLADR